MMVEGRPMKGNKDCPLSPTMTNALRWIKEWGGKVKRYPGGFWSSPQAFLSVTFGTSTIEALVKRGVMAYSEWKDGRNGRFPIEANLINIKWSEQKKEEHEIL